MPPDDTGPDSPTGRILRAPILRAVAAQALAVATLLAAIQGLWHGLAFAPPLWSKLATAALLAVLFSRILRLPRWWFAIQAALPFLVVGAIAAGLPGWSYGIGLALLVLLLGNSLLDRVPLYLTGRATRSAVAALLPRESPIRAVDLGCGLAGPLIAMAARNRHPASHFLGVETALFPYFVARTRIWFARDPRIAVQYRSLWGVDLGRFDIVYAFLSPEPMPRLLAKAAKEMRPGSKFVSNEFTDPAYPQTRVVVPDGAAGRPLHIWQSPFAASGERASSRE